MSVLLAVGQPFIQNFIALTAPLKSYVHRDVCKTSFEMLKQLT